MCISIYCTHFITSGINSNSLCGNPTSFPAVVQHIWAVAVQCQTDRPERAVWQHAHKHTLTSTWCSLEQTPHRQTHGSGMCRVTHIISSSWVIYHFFPLALIWHYVTLTHIYLLSWVFFLCVCPTNTLSFLNFLFYYWSRKLISFLSLFHSFKANLPLLQRELLHCARLAKQTPAQYLAQHEQLLLDANASSPLDSSEIMLEMNEHGKRRTPER